MSNRRHDPLIDALLEETLGGVTPPDLSPRILKAWSEHQSAANGKAIPRLNVLVDLEEPLPPPLVVGTVRLARDLSMHDSGPRKSLAKDSRNRRRGGDWLPLQLWGSLGAVAAVLLIAFVGVRVSNNVSPNTDSQRDPIARTNDPKLKPDPRNRADRDDKDFVPAPPLLADKDQKDPSRDHAPTSPNESLPTRSTSSDAEVVAFINEQLRASWQSHGIQPSAEATDEEWCRRTFLRLVGRIPKVKELNAFESNKAADKREQLVDQLLSDERYAAEFARHWSDVWANVLLGRGLGSDPQQPASRAGLQEYLQASLRQNKPYDRMALELISATGAGQPGADNFNGAANFLLAHASDDAAVATARTSRVFLGVQLQCVQCHDHPTAPLKQDSFWAMNAFFRQMKVAGQPGQWQLADQDYLGLDGQDEEGRVYYERPNGLVKVAEPTFIDGKTLNINSGRVSEVNRREQLAKLVVNSEYFERATMNRLWFQFLGFGFTRPVDNMVGTPASHPELLERVSQEFAASGYDLKRAMRWIALSDAFNRSSTIGAMQLADMPEAGTVALFSHYYTRQLPAEEVFRSLQIAAKLRQETGAGGNIEQARLSWLAQARKLGGEEGVIPSIAQSPIIRHATTPAQDTMLQAVLSSSLKFEAKVEHLFLAALSRKPSPQELELANSLGGMNAKNEAAALEDIWWALLNSSEFQLDH